jgi:two-component system sensor histidine kinase KdpD
VLAWLAALAGLTGIMVSVRQYLDKAHVALLYLLLVLAGSARGGRRIGLGVAVLAFLGFDYFFLPPYNTVVVADPLDWLVLLTFLATAAVAAQLLFRAQAAASAAEVRATEIDRLAALGAETLNAGRAEEALLAIAEVIRSTLTVGACQVFLSVGERVYEVRPPTAAPPRGRRHDPAASALLAVHRDAAVVEYGDGTTHLIQAVADYRVPEPGDLDGARAFTLPLRVRGRTVGALRIAAERPLALDAAQRRFFAALAYYAALGADRVRLMADADRAEALQESDRLKDALLAAVSHDLRTPLTTIKMLAHLIAEGGDERATTIEGEADRLNRSVADLLDLASLNAGALPLRLEANAAEDVVGAMLERASGATGAREIRVMIEGDGILLGRFDFVHTLRILVNLLENALKYAPSAAPIDIRVAREGATLAFEVADRGPGIPEPEIARVFEPFYRRSGSPPDVGGAGLGLSIAQRLAAAQDGSLLYHPREGGGSQFVLRLPALDPPIIS